MKLLSIALLSLTCLIAPGAEPVTNRVQWFSDAKCGMFVHWGLYSQLGGTWNGHTLPDKSLANGNSWYAEWIQKRLEVPDADYRALMKQFNPVNFDAEAWILEAKRAGMRYFVITAKHHDGFALWDSAVTDYDLGSTPCRVDLLGELAKACRKHGIKLGFYYSHWQDWGHEGGARPCWKGIEQPSQEAFSSYWKHIALAQVSELIDRYDPDLFWFDTWGNESKDFITPERRDEMISLIRTKSPRCLINGRICYHNPGNDIDFLETGDNEHPTKNLGRPWQTPATICHSWGWHANDFNWKSGRTLTELLAQNVSLGGNYLLNVGPKPDGSFPPAAVRRLRELGGWTAANQEAIYGAQPVADVSLAGVRFTRRNLPNGGERLYAFLVDVKGATLTVPIAVSRVKACQVLESGQPLAVSGGADGHAVIDMAKIKMDQSLPVLVFDLAGK